MCLYTLHVYCDSFRNAHWPPAFDCSCLTPSARTVGHLPRLASSQVIWTCALRCKSDPKHLNNIHQPQMDEIREVYHTGHLNPGSPQRN